MANGSIQLIGLLIACTGGLCTVIATFLPEWRRNDPSGEVLEAIVRHQGEMETITSIIYFDDEAYRGYTGQ